MKPLANPNLQGMVVLFVLAAVTGAFIYSNRQPDNDFVQPAAPVTPTAIGQPAWQTNLEEQIANQPTVTPSPDVEATQFVPPTLPPVAATLPAISGVDLLVTPFPTSTSFPTLALTPTPNLSSEGAATPVPLPAAAEELLDVVPVFETPQQFQLPPEEVPLGAHPNDHFWLTRPIDVSANSEYLFYYPYGSSGQGWRVHRGLDMPNGVGEEVQAAGSGFVVCAGRSDTATGDRCRSETFESYASYGNLVVIEHDFGWRGQPVWTLYAHLSALAVETGERVETGQVIGLVGTTGNVTGPHVHFEVRVGINSYFSTRNPMLWMAPFIGHGVVAGRVVDESGEFLDNISVQLNRGGRVIDRTTTYIDPYEPDKRVWTVVPDENWNENFAMGDIPAGEYELVIVAEGETFRRTVNVQPGTVSFEEVRLTGVRPPDGSFLQDEPPLSGEAPADTAPATAIPTPTAQP